MDKDLHGRVARKDVDISVVKLDAARKSGRRNGVVTQLLSEAHVLSHTSSGNSAA